MPSSTKFPGPSPLKAALGWILCALAIAAWPLQPQAGEAGDAARLIGGLPQVVSSWNGYETKIGRSLRAWSCRELGRAEGGTVFYPFSGPDLPAVVHLYPEAERYVLVSEQSAEAPPRLERLSKSELEGYLAAFRKAWKFYGALGFFRTEDLDVLDDAQGGRIGMTGPLMAFAVRLGYEVESVEPIQLDAGAQDVVPLSVKPGEAESWDSVRLTLRKGGTRVLVDYVRLDLRDGWLRQVDHARRWIDHMAWNPTVLKAASHLLQEEEFSFLRNSLLANAPSIVQDETGIEYAALAGAFEVRLHGRFTKANPSFAGGLQKSLAAAYRGGGTVKPLPFQFGYEKDAGSAVQVALRRSNARAPATEARHCPAAACRRC